MTTISDIQTGGKEWLYILSGYGDDLELIHNPIGWDAKKLTLTRNEAYFGLFRSFTADLSFIKEGFNFLHDIYEIYGVNAEVYLTVKRINFQTLEYSEKYRGKLDFATYKEDSKNEKSISLQISDNSFLEKLKAFESVEIPYDRLTTLTGQTITKFDSQDAYRTVELFGIEELFFGGFTVSSFYETFATYYPPVNIDNALDGFQNISGGATAQYFILNPSQNYTIRIKGTQTINAVWATTGTKTLKLEIKDVNNNNVFYTKTVSGSSEYSLQLIADIDIVADLKTNSNVHYLVTATGINFSYFSAAGEPFYCSLVSIIGSPVNIYCLPVHNAFTRVIEAITDKQNAFESAIFPATPTTYMEMLTNGLLVRGFPRGYVQDNKNVHVAQLTFTFKDLFDFANTIFNVGIEYDEDNEKIILKHKKYFFEDSEIFEVENIEDDSFNTELATDLFYNSIQAGYKTIQYEDVSGLQEYNNKSDFSTCINTIKNELEIVCPYYGQVYAFEYAKRARDLDRAEDTKFDKNIMILETYYAGSLYRQRRKENYNFVGGIEGVDNPMNLGLTPKRMLTNHSDFLNIGLQKFVTDSIKFNKSENTTTLKTRKTFESFNVEECTDLQNVELNVTKLTGFIVNFNAPLTLDQFNTIKQNQNGLIKYFNPIAERYEWGWIKEVSTEPVDNKPTNWSLYQSIYYLEDEFTIEFLADNDNEMLLTDDNKFIVKS